MGNPQKTWEDTTAILKVRYPYIYKIAKPEWVDVAYPYFGQWAGRCQTRKLNHIFPLVDDVAVHHNQHTGIS